MLKVVDAHMKEHVFGPIDVEIDDPYPISEDAWDWWSKCDIRAMEYLIPDMTCDAIDGNTVTLKRTEHTSKE